jgi:hypothetical protein
MPNPAALFVDVAVEVLVVIFGFGSPSCEREV